MGNAGKVVQRVRARELRAEGRTLLSIAEELGVSKSSVSLWVQGVEFTPTPRSRGHPSQSPSPLSLRKREQIEQLKLDGRRRVGQLSDREFLVAGAALYAAEGAKRDGIVAFANTDPRMILFMVTWLRRVFLIEEHRLRMKVYLHEDLDLDAAELFWSELTGIPRSQFSKAYRAVADASRRRARHVHGCATIVYSSTAVHRSIVGLTDALLSSMCLPG